MTDKDRLIRDQQKLINQQQRMIETLEKRLAEKQVPSYIPYPVVPYSPSWPYRQPWESPVWVTIKDTNTTGDSTAGSLLPYAGTWAGSDANQCLELIYATRSEAEF
jgi:hypothetical protein